MKKTFHRATLIKLIRERKVPVENIMRKRKVELVAICEENGIPIQEQPKEPEAVEDRPVQTKQKKVQINELFDDDGFTEVSDHDEESEGEEEVEVVRRVQSTELKSRNEAGNTVNKSRTQNVDHKKIQNEINKILRKFKVDTRKILKTYDDGEELYVEDEDEIINMYNSLKNSVEMDINSMLDTNSPNKLIIKIEKDLSSTTKMVESFLYD